MSIPPFVASVDPLYARIRPEGLLWLDVEAQPYADDGELAQPTCGNEAIMIQRGETREEKDGPMR